MEFEYIEKKEQGKFINRYDVHYKMVDGNEKVYEMISRNPDLKSFEDLQNGYRKLGIQLSCRPYRSR